MQVAGQACLPPVSPACALARGWPQREPRALRGASGGGRSPRASSPLARGSPGPCRPAHGPAPPWPRVTCRPRRRTCRAAPAPCLAPRPVEQPPRAAGGSARPVATPARTGWNPAAVSPPSTRAPPPAAALSAQLRRAPASVAPLPRQSPTSGARPPPATAGRSPGTSAQSQPLGLVPD
eukprot:scaffold8069_cov126-Isochrysis_galbana.AAC.4